MDKKPFGTLLILDANDCQGELKDKSHIQKFIDELVQKLGMKKKGETVFEYFPSTKFNIENDIVGWSVVQIISLSSITIHINEISKTIYFDCFTCSSLDETVVSLLFSDYFKPTKLKKQLIVRDAKSLA